MKRKVGRERIMKIILILVMAVLLVFICVGCKAGYSTESGEISGSDRNEIFKAVLLGNSPFVYCSDGNYEGWDTFVANHQPVTEEEYLDAVSRQDQKQNAEWYEFSN